jgi:16S rRNA (uracil1498-N3)-methyltransferase
MNKFFVLPQQISFPYLVIKGSDVRHISKVLRLRQGEHILVADGTGREYLAELQEIGKETVKAFIKESRQGKNEPPLDVYLIQGLPKGEKFDLIVQKGTEIGIKKIIPVNMERTIVQITKDKAEKRRERWQRIAGEAAKQCRRSIIPQVDSATELGHALNSIPSGTVIIVPWESECTRGIKGLLNDLNNISSVAILIGPEGGIAPEEVALAEKYGAQTVSLGPRILRTETAGLVAAVLVLYHFGDLGGCLVE